jgi:hypothetical protein
MHRPSDVVVTPLDVINNASKTSVDDVLNYMPRMYSSNYVYKKYFKARTAIKCLTFSIDRVVHYVLT